MNIFEKIESESNNIEWIKSLRQLGFTFNLDLSNDHNLAELILLKTESREVMDYVFEEYLKEMSFMSKKEIMDNTVNLKFIYECIVSENNIPLFECFIENIKKYEEINNIFFSLKKTYFSSLLLKDIDLKNDKEKGIFLMDMIMKEGDVHRNKESWNSKFITLAEELFEKHEIFMDIATDTYILNLEHDKKRVREPLNLNKMLNKLFFNMEEKFSQQFISKTLSALVDKFEDNDSGIGIVYPSYIEDDSEALLVDMLKMIMEKDIFNKNYQQYIDAFARKNRAEDVNEVIEQFVIYSESKLLRNQLSESVDNSSKRTLNRI